MESLLQSNPSCELVILGDFNVHHSEWLSSRISDAAGIKTEAFAIANELKQLVTSPTRIPDRLTDRPNLLDLYLTNIPHLYSNVEVNAPIGTSDHCAVSDSHTERRCFYTTDN